MGKAVIGPDGSVYRTRRGQLVKIPDEWVGNFTTPQTIRKRDSKLTNKLARQTKWRRANKGSSGGQYIKFMNHRELYDPDID